MRTRGKLRRETREIQAQLAHRVLKVNRDRKGLRVRRETPVQLGLRDHGAKREMPLPTMILPRLSC